MRIYPSKQSDLPPPDKPLVINPVLVEMDIPLFYMTERGPVPWAHKIFCGKAFADTVLKELNTLFIEHSVGLVHIGFYNPRKARHKDGSPIVPTRWSNHAYGEAVDFKGITTDATGDSFLGIAAMKQKQPNLLSAINQRVSQAIVSYGRRAEIVDEGDWLHIGLWPSSAN